MCYTNLAYHLDRTANLVKPVSIIQDHDRLSPLHPAIAVLRILLTVPSLKELVQSYTCSFF